MLSFFQKKTYLIDLLEGFVDIHNHILPGIDDGAQNTDESIELIKSFAEFGVKDFVCTPHIMHNYHDNTPETIQGALNTLKEGLGTQNITDVTVAAAAEHMIDDNFEIILEGNEVMPLGQNYLLVEMSFLQAPIHFDEVLELVKKKNYFPILAHPERYRFLHDQFDKYSTIKDRGVLFQLNLLSLGEYYGGDIQKMAYRLIENNLIDFLASDVHNMRQLDFLKTIKVSEKERALLQPIVERTVYNFK